MHIRELLPKIGREPLPPVLLFCPGTAPFGGEAFEPFLAERALERIVAAYVDPGLHDLTYSVFYADEANVGEIVMEARTLPFLAERRVIVLRNAERYMQMSGDKRSPLAPLLEYLQAPAESTLLMMVTDGADKRKRFYTACRDAGALVECPGLTEAELEKWVETEVRARGKAIASAAVKELLGRAGKRLGDVNNTVSLLVSYLGEKPRIEEEDVIAACADVAEETVWKLTDAIARSDSAQALHSLHQLLDYGKSHDEIIGTINWMLESAYKADPATKAEPPSSFVMKKVRPVAEKLGVAKLKDALALCTKTHFMLRTTGVDRDLALELLVIKYAWRPKRKG